MTTLQAPERNKESVKGELVDSARQKWPLYFSRFYEVTMTSGESILMIIISITFKQQWLQKRLYRRTAVEDQVVCCGRKLERHHLPG